MVSEIPVRQYHMCQQRYHESFTKRREKGVETYLKNNGQIHLKFDPRIAVYFNQEKDKRFMSQTHHSQILKPNTKGKVLWVF